MSDRTLTTIQRDRIAIIISGLLASGNYTSDEFAGTKIGRSKDLQVLIHDAHKIFQAIEEAVQ